MSLSFINNIFVLLVLVYVSDGPTARTNFTLDLGLDNKQYAIVTGTAFTLVNSVSGIAMGY